MNPPPSQQTLELSFPKQGGHEMGVSPAVGDSTSVDGPTCDLKKCKHFLSTSAVMSLHSPLIPGQKIPIICPAQGTFVMLLKKKKKKKGFSLQIYYFSEVGCENPTW